MFKIEIIDNIQTNSKKIDFSYAFEKQKIILDEIINKKRNESLWFLEHNPVYTAGKSVSDDEIFENQDKIPVIKTNRGGKFTYHGPGQLIVYIFLNIKNVFHHLEPDLQKFILMIEKWVLISLSDLKITNLSLKPEVNHGVWIENKKISAIGINVQKWVSSHGVSININPEMRNFRRIIPCGLKNYGVTSIKEEGFEKISNLDVMNSLIKNFNSIFVHYYI